MSESVWHKIPAREVKVGDRVSVIGITNTRSVILDVNYVDTAPGQLVFYGLQPWGTGTREVTRIVHPEAVVDRYVAPEVEA